MNNLIGQSLGRYHILEQLGEGGMATVYKAYDTRLERDVAVKIIRRQAFPEEQLERILKRFEREAKALARLTHPNIVGVIDYGDYEGAPYLVMPYLPGGTLKQRLSMPMSWQEAVHILLPIAQALAYAHEHNIIHRDIKPSNILLTENGQPMLSDFGIAKILENEDSATLTGTGVGVGTPEYMAPEQWTGKASSQSDIYSLGVVLYELVTGHKPYTADTPAAILLKQATEPLPRPGQFVRVPEAIEKILLKAMAKNPEDRYPDMAVFARALEGLLTGRAVIAQPATTLKSGTPPVRSTNIALQETTRGGMLSPQVGQENNLSIQSSKKKKWIPWVIGAVVLLALAATFWGIPYFAKQGALVPKAMVPTLNASKKTVTLNPTSSLPVGSTWTRPADHMVMVYVPAGKFLMGSSNSDSMAGDEEKPQHTVMLDAYWIDKTEVTNLMYAECVNAKACNLPSVFSSQTRSNYYYDSRFINYPVIFVKWIDSNAYCAWAGARLPTEAEWEKAARGPDGRIYPWGNTKPTCSLANYYAEGGTCMNDTSAVGSYPSGTSPYGVMDMAGNVWEWVNDWYSPTYYSQSPTSNPQGPSSGNAHVLRGGSWNDTEFTIRASNRFSGNPSSITDIYFGTLSIGFRCARSATSP